MTDVTEAEFFSKYAENYSEPEVVWLERIINSTGYPLSPNIIANAIVKAGYVRRSTQTDGDKGD